MILSILSCSQVNMPGERSQEEWEELIKHHESIADADLTSVMEHDQYQHEQDLPQYIDHTLLKLDANQAQIDQLCEEAKEHSFKVGASILLLSFHLIIGEIDMSLSSPHLREWSLDFTY